MKHVAPIIVVVIAIFILCVGLYTGYSVGKFNGRTESESIIAGLEVRLADGERIAGLLNSRLGRVRTVLVDAGKEVKLNGERARGVTDKLRRAYILIEGSEIAITAIEKSLVLLPVDDGGIVNP